MSHRARRLLTPISVIAGLAAAFTAGAVLSQEPAGPGNPPDRARTSGGDASPVAFTGSDLSLASSCTELLDWYVDRAVARVGPWGWDSPYLGDGDVVMLDSGVSGSGSFAGAESRAAKAPLPATSRVTNDGTGTNVQESGVDEPDAVKTDGRTLFRMEGDDLVTYDVTGDTVVRLGSADLVDLDSAEILLAGETVVAIGQDTVALQDRTGHPDEAPSTRVVVLDVSDPAAPVLEHTFVYDTSLVTARLHGSTVRLVLQAGLPDLDFVSPDRGHRGDEREATRENQQVVRDSTIEDWLPTVSVDGGPAEQLMDCEDVALPSDATTLGTIAVVGFDAEDPQAPSVSGLAVEKDLAYASVSKL